MEPAVPTFGYRRWIQPTAMVKADDVVAFNSGFSIFVVMRVGVHLLAREWEELQTQSLGHEARFGKGVGPRPVQRRAISGSGWWSLPGPGPILLCGV